MDETQSESLELNFTSDRVSLARSLHGFHSSILAIAAKTNEVLPLWRCAWREPSPYTYRGRLVLVGDAAHAMLPYLGQGAAQAIEDGAALGVLLQGITAGESSKGNGGIEARLKLFEKVRRDRTTAIQMLSGSPVGEDGYETVGELWDKHLPGHQIPSMWLFHSYDVGGMNHD